MQRTRYMGLWFVPAVGWGLAALDLGASRLLGLSRLAEPAETAAVFAAT